ncbi:nuclear transport factor 2 family protein [Pseudomonas argentinensis]|uniref:nuclear transport factor 2 family protein n=1 Tax=Phytopseudomonas argentinensis TaxID=289370 RepID=UPI0008AA137B|nr:nuclear transport factor 2 family protein [Pseudomonas argentinensis]
MSDRQYLSEVVEAAYAAFSSRNPQGLLKLCTSDCHWQAPGLSDLMPWVGEHRGHAGVLEFVQLLDQHLDFITFAAQSLIVDEVQDQIVAIGVARCRVKSTGRIYVNHWAHLFTFRDGLIKGFREYPDTAAQLVAIHPALSVLATAPEGIHHD